MAPKLCEFLYTKLVKRLTKNKGLTQTYVHNTVQFYTLLQICSKSSLYYLLTSLELEFKFISK